MIRRLCVFCGSSTGARPEYLEAARAVGELAARREVALVYGGAAVGLMGALADAALARGGEVHGVMPRGLVDKEIAHRGLTSLRVTDSMHERKAIMANLSDAFVALPGGTGTLDELFEVFTWWQLGLHAKPVALLDVDGYWRPLVAMLDGMVAEGFVKKAHRESLIVVETAEELFARLDA